MPTVNNSSTRRSQLRRRFASDAFNESNPHACWPLIEWTQWNSSSSIYYILVASRASSDAESALLEAVPFETFCLHMKIILKLFSIPCCSEWSCSNFFLSALRKKNAASIAYCARYFPESRRDVMFPWKRFLEDL